MKSKRKRPAKINYANRPTHATSRDSETITSNNFTKCDLCCDSFNCDPDSLYVLNENKFRQVLKLINIQYHKVPKKEREIFKVYSCEDCKAKLDSLLNLFDQLVKIRSTFNELKRLIAKQVMLGPLEMSDTEWEEWEKHSSYNETCKCSTSEEFGTTRRLFQEEDSTNDSKLNQMTAVVLLTRLESSELPPSQLALQLKMDDQVVEDLSNDQDHDNVLEGFINPMRKTGDGFINQRGSSAVLETTKCGNEVILRNHCVMTTNTSEIDSDDIILSDTKQSEETISKTVNQTTTSINEISSRTETLPTLITDDYQEFYFIDVKSEADEQPDNNASDTEEANGYADSCHTIEVEDSDLTAESLQNCLRQLRKRRQVGSLNTEHSNKTTPREDDDDDETPSFNQNSHSDKQISASDEFYKSKRARLNSKSVGINNLQSTGDGFFDEDDEPRKNKFKCTICKKKLASKRSLKTHINLIHNRPAHKNIPPQVFFGPKQIFECSACFILFKSQEQLRSHMIGTHSLFKCPWCKYQTKTPYDLTEHKRMEHIVRSNLVKTLKKRHKTKKCRICSTLMSSTGIERMHMASLHGIFTVEPTLKCTHCDLTFNDNSLLGAHKLYVHSVGSVQQGNSQCDFCLRFLRCDSNLKKHKQNVHYRGDKNTPDNLKCFICSESQSFSTVEDLKLHEQSETHKQIMNSRIKAHCNVCKKNFDKDIEGLQDHLNSKEHEEEVTKLGEYDRGKFCVPCRQSFNSFEELKKHEAVGMAHTKIVEQYKRGVQEKETSKIGNNFRCHACPQTFRDKVALTRHITKFHPAGGHKCKSCEIVFAEWTELTRHRETHKKQKKSVKSVTCHECGKSFGHIQYMYAHTRNVHSKETFKCEVCDRSFHAIVLLRNHVRIVHDREHLRLECPYCDVLVYNQPILLRKHFCKSHPSIYLKEKPRYCAICYYNFIDESELASHLMEKHANLKCPHCGKYSPNLAHLRAHIRVHTGERPFQCDLCDCKFKSNGNLTNHKKAVHNSETHSRKRKIESTKTDKKSQ